MNGVIVVDKPSGCTSHDIVQRVRKAIGQRSVGHAGTLDPLATGVLVVAVGEATKLVSHLQSQDKRYEVTVALGVETDSLDSDGTVTSRVDVPSLDAARVTASLEAFVGTHPQQAPALSAIKVDGTPLHRRVRRGESVEAPVRDVVLHEASVDRVSGGQITLTLHCGKGFYVRSLARDLARALGTVGHVTALRRTESGPFDLGRAIDGDAITRETVVDGLLSLAEACASLVRVELDDPGVEHARHGRTIARNHLRADSWLRATPGVPLALFGPDGEPVAIGERNGDEIRVVRGFVSHD